MHEVDHLTELTLASDTDLVASVRDGDRIAFGLLYLRHHEAAWRVACAVTGFADVPGRDAEVALMEGFAAVFAALPRHLHGPDSEVDVPFRPYLLACVRQAGLERLARTQPAQRRPAVAAAAPVDEICLDDDLVLSGLEHHVVRSALRRLPESWRTALWLTEVEAMTPKEVAAIVDLEPGAVTHLTGQARAAVRLACVHAQRECDVRPGCRFTVDRLGAYVDGGLTRSERLHIKAHIDRCVPCRMRRSELSRLSSSLTTAVPATPLLAGECQRHWMEQTRPWPWPKPSTPSRPR